MLGNKYEIYVQLYFSGIKKLKRGAIKYMEKPFK